VVVDALKKWAVGCIGVDMGKCLATSHYGVQGYHAWKNFEKYYV